MNAYSRNLDMTRARASRFRVIFFLLLIIKFHTSLSLSLSLSLSFSYAPFPLNYFQLDIDRRGLERCHVRRHQRLRRRLFNGNFGLRLLYNSLHLRQL